MPSVRLDFTKVSTYSNFADFQWKQNIFSQRKFNSKPTHYALAMCQSLIVRPRSEDTILNHWEVTIYLTAHKKIGQLKVVEEKLSRMFN